MWNVSAGSLENSVLESIKALQKLVTLARGKKIIQLEVRLYRTDPILFLVQTDFVSYVQQYHFGKGNNSNHSAPIFRFQSRKGIDTHACSMQENMESHFNYLWENFSVGLDDYLENYAQGCDVAIRRANIANILYLWVSN
ncbi:MAG: hypothetical protein ACOYYU_04840 [Chloroflexota bacterium]